MLKIQWNTCVTFYERALTLFNPEQSERKSEPCMVYSVHILYIHPPPSTSFTLQCLLTAKTFTRVLFLASFYSHLKTACRFPFIIFVFANILGQSALGSHFYFHLVCLRILFVFEENFIAFRKYFIFGIIFFSSFISYTPRKYNNINRIE